MRNRLLLLGLLVATPLLGEMTLWKEFLEAKTGRAAPLLPDFSYAGYRHGEVPLPQVAGPVFRVGDYGAKPGDAANDAESIQKAIDACGKAGGGVVLFEKGVYLINENEEGTNSLLWITNSNVVLRGAGSGEDGTVLYSPKKLLPINPKEMYTGRSPIWIGARTYGTRTNAVVEAAALNAFSLRLATGHDLRKGDRISLRVRRPPAEASKWIAPLVWEERFSVGIRLEEFHEVKEVDGDRIVLAEPLLVPIKDPEGWFALKVEFVSEVGVEGIRFRGEASADFVHHRSWIDDSAWRGLKVEGLEHGWIRDCHFEKMNWSVQINASRQITMRDVTLSGPATHFGVQVCKSTGVLGDRIVDLAGHHHGPSLENSACGTVYLHCQWRSNGSFDSHASNPYANLYDSCAGGIEIALHNGGAPTYYIHHLHALVLWNQRVTATPKWPVDFWNETAGQTRYPFNWPLRFAQVIAAGLHGESPNLKGDAHLARNESMGTPVAPGSLYVAQLRERIGTLPSDLRTDRPAWIAPPTPRPSASSANLLPAAPSSNGILLDAAGWSFPKEPAESLSLRSEEGFDFLRVQRSTSGHSLAQCLVPAPRDRGSQVVLQGKARGATTWTGPEKWNVARVALILLADGRPVGQSVLEIPGDQPDWKPFRLAVPSLKFDSIRVAFGLQNCAGRVDVTDLVLTTP